MKQFLQRGGILIVFKQAKQLNTSAAGKDYLPAALVFYGAG